MARISIFSFLFILLISLISSVSAQKLKVIFDCDLVGDVDDTFALAMLVSSPDIELLGVALDYRDTEMRGTMTSRFLCEIGREDIPVAIGLSTGKEEFLDRLMYLYLSQNFNRFD